MVSIEFLTGQNGFFDVDRTGFQKLGCFYTSRSALSEVIPRYAFGHGLLLNGDVGQKFIRTQGGVESRTLGLSFYYACNKALLTKRF